MNTHLKDVVIDDEKLRYVEIYQIINNITGKKYIGQAVSHILNHKRYRPYGMNGRFKCHISEAYSTKKNQCQFLNNSIRKHGSANFSVQLITTCSIDHADEIEAMYITNNNTIYPFGYNLKIGGITFKHTDESRRRVAIGLKKFNIEKKVLRFKNITFDTINLEQYIRPLNRHGIQYGWYILINKIKADFGGIHTKLEDSKVEAYEFLNQLINNCKTP